MIMIPPPQGTHPYLSLVKETLWPSAVPHWSWHGQDITTVRWVPVEAAYESKQQTSFPIGD